MLSYVMTHAADKLLRLYRPTAETIRDDPRWYTQPLPRAEVFSDVRGILRALVELDASFRKNEGETTDQWLY